MREASQHSIPLPPAGALEKVPESSETLFNWDYKVHKDQLMNLYEKSKRLQWNASTDIDWSIDVDPEEFPDFMPPESFNAMMNPPRRLTIAEIKRMRVHQLGWMLSQFMHGEQGALLATAQIVNTVPWTEAKFYAAAQVADDARRGAPRRLRRALARGDLSANEREGASRARGLRHRVRLPDARSAADARSLGAPGLGRRSMGQLVARDAVHVGVSPAAVLEDRT